MYNSFKIFLLLAGILLINNCEGDKKTSISDELSLRIVKTAESPVIDGVLNEDCWKNAQSNSLNLCLNGEKPLYPTTVRVCYDDTYLYIGFECQDPDAASTVTKYDGPVSQQDYISVYIDADSDLKAYVIIDVAPTGAVSDAFVLSNNNRMKEKILYDWNCEGLRTSVSVYGGGAVPGTQDRFWRVELALPFEEFITAPHIPPSPGDSWRINFYRKDITNGWDISAYVPTGSENFHKPSKFAWLFFEE
ncbi:MAG TPA: hypothetical protein ENH82_06575 [bacterium]|nr:hypothetical protein [bacterium]